MRISPAVCPRSTMEYVLVCMQENRLAVMMDELEQKKSALEDVSPRVDAMNLDMQGLRERVLEHEQTIATLQVRVLSYHSRNHSRFGSLCARIFIKWVDIHA